MIMGWRSSRWGSLRFGKGWESGGFFLFLGRGHLAFAWLLNYELLVEEGLRGALGLLLFFFAMAPPFCHESMFHGESSSLLRAVSDGLTCDELYHKLLKPARG